MSHPTATRSTRRLRAVTISAIAVLALSGCTTPTPRGPVTEVDSFDWRNFEGTEIDVLLSEHPLATSLKKHVTAFEEKTGITVNIESLTETDYMVKILSELQSGSGGYDAFMTSQPMNYQYAAAGWVEDLQPWIDDDRLTAPDWDFDDLFPALIESSRWTTEEWTGAGEGGLWSLPANEEGYALFYRADILDAAGIEVPQTIDKLIDAAEALDGTQFDGKEISGFVSRGDKTYPTLNPFSTFFLGYGATDVTDGRATINSPEAIEATEKWAELMSYGPEAGSTFTWYEAQQEFVAGNAAFYIDADHMATDFEKDGTAIEGKVGYALPPAGPAGRGSNLWLWSLGMNAASQEKEATWLFLQWATSVELMTASLEDGNINPTRISVAESPEMAAVTEKWGEYNEIWKEILDEHARWAYAPSAVWTEAGDIWATAIQSILIGRSDTKEALDRAAAEIDALIE